MHDNERDSLAEMPDMNPGPVCRLDLDGTVHLANAAARSIFSEDIVGCSWLGLNPQLSPDLWDQMLAGSERLNYEATIGGCDYSFTLAHRPGSEQVFVFGSDVSALKIAELELERRASELAEMARFPEMNPGPVCRLDRDACVVLANQAARRLFADEDLVGRCLLELPVEVSDALWEQVVGSAKPTLIERRVLERDLVFTLTPGGGNKHIFMFGTDITEQKTAERVLQQSEKMATLGTLAAGVAHELNNPAAAAQRAAEHLADNFGKMQQANLGLAQLDLSDAEQERVVALDAMAKERGASPSELDPLARSEHLDEIEDWLEERGVSDGWELAPALIDMDFGIGSLNALERDFDAEQVPVVVVWLSRAFPVYSLLAEIAHGAGRISEIVGALRAYSYLGQGPMQLVDVNEGLRHTLIILRSKLKAGITVEQKFDDELPRIMAYGGELNQVWTNLIDNAASAMNGRGSISIRTRLDGDWVVVDIEDAGPGIPEENVPRIFDAFFTTKAPGEGTGLGLNTSYNIVVQKHHGHIDVDSQPGRTRFTVKVPLDVQKARDTTPGTEVEPSADTRS